MQHCTHSTQGSRLGTVGGNALLSRLYTQKRSFLPSQARTNTGKLLGPHYPGLRVEDKKAFSASGIADLLFGVVSPASRLPMSIPKVKKRLSLRHSILNMIILPRRAPDNHRES